ncbi:unnamed protein product [Ixodes persulcatus]
MASFLTLSGQISSNSLPIQCKLPKSTDVVFALTAPRRLLGQKSGNLRALMHSLNIKFFGCLKVAPPRKNKVPYKANQSRQDIKNQLCNMKPFLFTKCTGISSANVRQRESHL